MARSLEPGVDQGSESGLLHLDLARLSIGEQLLIWALRMRLARGPGGPVRGFRLAFARGGVESALASFEALFGFLQRHCRADIGLHAPRCRCVSRDEMTVANVIAAFQAGAPLHAYAIAARLVDGGVMEGFLGHARDLAGTLTDNRLRLPVRSRVGCGGQPQSVH